MQLFILIVGTLCLASGTLLSFEALRRETGVSRILYTGSLLAFPVLLVALLCAPMLAS